jgi:hypothetical protein
MERAACYLFLEKDPMVPLVGLRRLRRKPPSRYTGAVQLNRLRNSRYLL